MALASRWFALIVFAAGAPASQSAPRSHAAKAEFQRLHPCPSTGKSRGACGGWEIDHVTPLCAGGVDAPANMQWLTVAEHKAKTRGDVAACRANWPPQLPAESKS